MTAAALWVAVSWCTFASSTFDCDLASTQSFDGTCNNVANPSQGASFQPYRRGSEGAEFEDGVSAMVTNRPPPRTISNLIGKEDPATSIEDPITHSMLAVMFGQFINHDFESNDKEKLFVSPRVDPTVFAKDLIVPDPNDDFCFFPPGVPGIPSRCDPANGPYHISYRTSAGSTSTGQFEVTNRGTSYLDLGLIYGNSAADAAIIRSHLDGKLKTSDYNGLLPFPPGGPGIPFSFQDMPPPLAVTGLETETLNFIYPAEEVLTQGDYRMNNNVALAGFHTLFTREHNYQAEQYALSNPSADDEEIYQAARRRNIAQFQNIVLEDYLPAEFGEYFANIVGSYTEYDDSVDATTSAAFAGAAFRYGHSAVRGYKPLTECGVVSTLGFGPESELPQLGQTGGPINIPAMMVLAGNAGFEPVFRGLVAAKTFPIDTKIDDGLRNIVIPGAFGRVGIDLFAIDIQRGRINGIPNYNALRTAYHPEGNMYGSPGCGRGLEDNEVVDDPFPCFVRLVSGVSPGQASDEQAALANNLRDLYGKVNKIDAIVGLLAEPHVSGTSFGETLGRIVVDQYKRARDGDRFWYQNVYSTPEQEEVREVTMKTLLERNFALTNLPDNVFVSPHYFAGDLADSCAP